MSLSPHRGLLRAQGAESSRELVHGSEGKEEAGLGTGFFLHWREGAGELSVGCLGSRKKPDAGEQI